ncbi:MAG: RAMP superfamily CRISPR-associated protein [Acidobacteriota bacterium]
MPVKLTFEIELHSDYHVSAGGGLGAGVDSALLRESDGVPVLRGTAVTGLLRDGLWRLLQLQPFDQRNCERSGKAGEGTPLYCGQYNPYADECPVCRLFGTPRTPKRWDISSARPVGLEQVGSSKSGWKPGTTAAQVVHRVRINPQTRRAEAGKLFSQEQGDGRLHFRFTADCGSEGEKALDEAALLMAAARNVRELGRSRRRGQGECRIHLAEPASLPGVTKAEDQSLEQALLNRFETRWLSKQAPARSIPSRLIPKVAVAASVAPHTVRRRLIVRIDEPITLARRGDAGNQFETLDAISGVTLRGAFAACIAERVKLDEKTNYEGFVGLILRGQVSFSSLCPAELVGHGDALYPCIPAPRDLLTCKIFPGLAVKPDQHGAQGFAHQSSPAAQQCPQCWAEKKEKTPLRALDGFVVAKQPPQPFHLSQRSELHIQINPVQQRVATGDLFAYSALDAGQYFVGEVTFADDAAWQRFQQMTGLPALGQAFELRLGKATRRGYGRVTARFEDGAGKEPVWIGVPLENRVTDPQQLTLTLLTDTIITDAWGRYHLSFDADWMGRELKLTVDPSTLNVFASTRHVDGFNGHLGLPRWRDTVIEAGSSVGLRLVEPPEDWQQRLREVERDGIGLRREEGFGRVVFNHPVYVGGQGITQSDLQLGNDLRLGDGEHLLRKEDRFEKEWQRVLDREKHWVQCQSEMFAAVARWLLARHAESELNKELLKLADSPSQELRDLIPDYGDRSKESKLNPKGLELISKLLRKLEELVGKYGKQCQARGVMMLADRVAATAELARKGKRQ